MQITIHSNLSAIFRVFNSSHHLDKEEKIKKKVSLSKFPYSHLAAWSHPNNLSAPQEGTGLTDCVNS